MTPRGLLDEFHILHYLWGELSANERGCDALTRRQRTEDLVLREDTGVRDVDAVNRKVVERTKV